MITRAVVAHTHAKDSAAAAADLAAQVRQRFGDQRPDALLLFASTKFDHGSLLRGLADALQPVILVGASSAGELSTDGHGVDSACAIALIAPEMKLTATCARDLRANREEAARALAAGFAGTSAGAWPHHTALVLTDALAGHADEFVEHLTALLGGRYRLFGGGAGGDDAFAGRAVFFGTEVVEDGVVALEMLSSKPIGIGARHGWVPSSAPMRVTEAESTRLGSLNAVPAADVIEEHAERTAQPFDRAAPLPFFLHNVLGVDTGKGHKLRVPLSIASDGALHCATEVPEGTSVCVMSITERDAADAAGASAKEALAMLNGNKPAVALFFDCVATRLRMGKGFGREVAAVQEAVGDTRLAGCNTIGQIVSSTGQFSGFHNCTAVVCLLPE